MNTNYYIYAYFDGDEPIYVGAGSDNAKRYSGMRRHLKDCLNPKHRQYESPFYRRLRQLVNSPGLKTIKLLEGLTRPGSFRHEKFFIAAVGTVKMGRGPLLNQNGEGAKRWSDTDKLTTPHLERQRRRVASRRR